MIKKNLKFNFLSILHVWLYIMTFYDFISRFRLQSVWINTLNFKRYRNTCAVSDPFSKSRTLNYIALKPLSKEKRNIWTIWQRRKRVMDFKIFVIEFWDSPLLFQKPYNFSQRKQFNLQYYCFFFFLIKKINILSLTKKKFYLN